MNKKIISVLLTFALLLTGLSMNNVKAAKIKLNKTSLTLVVGQSFTLKLTGAKKDKISWGTSDKKIVSVTQKGKLKAKKEGYAAIAALYKKKSYICMVTVKKKGEIKATPTSIVTPTPTPNVDITETPEPIETPEFTETPESTSRPTATPVITSEPTPIITNTIYDYRNNLKDYLIKKCAIKSGKYIIEDTNRRNNTYMINSIEHEKNSDMISLTFYIQAPSDTFAGYYNWGLLINRFFNSHNQYQHARFPSVILKNNKFHFFKKCAT